MFQENDIVQTSKGKIGIVMIPSYICEINGVIGKLPCQVKLGKKWFPIHENKLTLVKR